MGIFFELFCCFRVVRRLLIESEDVGEDVEG